MIRKRLEESGGPTIQVVAADRGPGIESVDRVLARGYTTHERSLGIGLPGVRRLMDFCEIASKVGTGTVVRVEKRRRKF